LADDHVNICSLVLAHQGTLFCSQTENDIQRAHDGTVSTSAGVTESSVRSEDERPAVLDPSSLRVVEKFDESLFMDICELVTVWRRCHFHSR
jgi:hypothetical protein